MLGQPIEREYSLADLLRRPGVSYATLLTLPAAGPGVADPVVAEQVEIATKYEGYIDRQQDEVARQRAQEELALPPDLDYRAVRGLSTEVQQKLNQHRPETVGQAARIAGITPAAISLLLVHLKRGFPRHRRQPRAPRRPAPTAQRAAVGMSATGRPEREYRSAQHGGSAAPIDAALDDGVRALGLALPPGATAQLAALVALLAKWNGTYNLTAVREPAKMVTHHLLDSLAVLPHLAVAPGARLLDVGQRRGAARHPARHRAAGLSR